MIPESNNVGPQTPEPGWPWFVLAGLIIVAGLAYWFWRKEIRPRDGGAGDIFPRRSLMGVIAGAVSSTGNWTCGNFSAAADFWVGPILIVGPDVRQELPLRRGFGRRRQMVAVLEQNGFTPLTAPAMAPRGWLTVDIQHAGRRAAESR